MIMEGNMNRCCFLSRTKGMDFGVENCYVAHMKGP